jgi:hypothetical protein
MVKRFNDFDMLVAIILASTIFFLLGSVLGCKSERDWWKQKVKSGKMQELKNIIEVEDTAEHWQKMKSTILKEAYTEK